MKSQRGYALFLGLMGILLFIGLLLLVFGSITYAQMPFSPNGPFSIARII